MEHARAIPETVRDSFVLEVFCTEGKSILRSVPDFSIECVLRTDIGQYKPRDDIKVQPRDARAKIEC